MRQNAGRCLVGLGAPDQPPPLLIEQAHESDAPRQLTPELGHAPVVPPLVKIIRVEINAERKGKRFRNSLRQTNQFCAD